MKDKLNKALGFIKKYKTAFIIGISVIAVLATVLIVAIGGNNTESGSESEHKWGEGITENIPEFSAEPDSVNISKTNAAAYYSSVKSEQINDYIKLLERECKIKFEGEKYPRKAVMGDKIIVIHYNVTEMNFSVTVASTGDIANTVSGDQK